MRLTNSNNNSTHAHATVELIPGDSALYCDSSIPTIELSCSERRYSDACSTRSDAPIYANATLSTVASTSDDDYDESSVLGSGSDESSVLAVAEMVSASSTSDDDSERVGRAEFVSATVMRKSRTTAIGIKLKKVESSLKIIYLSNNGLFSETVTPLRVGDTLMSINNAGCAQMDEFTADRYLDSLVGPITLIAHNENNNGDPNIVESMITKMNQDDISGIGFRSRFNGPLISSISSNGLFASSLLNIGDQVCSINGVDCEELDCWSAASLIKSAPKNVTIVSKTLGRTGSVLAASNARHRRAKYLCATVYKPTAETTVGIGLQMIEYTRTLKITSISGLLKNSPFCVGDTLVSINKKKCKGMSHEQVVQLLQAMTGEITLVAHNKLGDERLVEAMVTKTPRKKPAVILKKDSKGRAIVYNVSSKSFLALSLKVGEMLSINGVPCDNLDLRTLSDVIQNARNHVTVVAKKRNKPF